MVKPAAMEAIDSEVYQTFVFRTSGQESRQSQLEVTGNYYFAHVTNSCQSAKSCNPSVNHCNQDSI